MKKKKKLKKTKEQLAVEKISKEFPNSGDFVIKLCNEVLRLLGRRLKNLDGPTRFLFGARVINSLFVHFYKPGIEFGNEALKKMEEKVKNEVNKSKEMKDQLNA